MTITVQINTITAAGKRIEKQLRRYPDQVQFIEPSVVSDAIPQGYVSLKDGLNEVRKHITINAKTITGKKLLHELQSHPKVVKIEYPYPIDNEGKPVESVSAEDSAKLAFHKLGEKYNRTFDNRYTR